MKAKFPHALIGMLMAGELYTGQKGFRQCQTKGVLGTDSNLYAGFRWAFDVCQRERAGCVGCDRHGGLIVVSPDLYQCRSLDGRQECLPGVGGAGTWQGNHSTTDLAHNPTYGEESLVELILHIMNLQQKFYPG